MAGPRARAANASTPGRTRRSTARGITLFPILSLLSALAGCGESFDNCQARRNCPSGGNGGAAGSTTTDGDAGSPSLGGSGAMGGAGAMAGAGEGGSAEGGADLGGAGGASGAAGAAGAAGNGGVGGAPPCDGACGGATPSCHPVSNQCVECLEQADCSDPAASRCDLADHTCKPCSIDADCSNIVGKRVCLAGSCVECTATKATACGSKNGTPLVCDSLEHTCTTQAARSAGLCQPCVSDAQCVLGQLCVLDTLDLRSSLRSVGYFCHWKQGDSAHDTPASCFTEGRPYSRLVTDVLSIDGETADICTLRTSSCPAHNEFRDKNCTPTGSPDDMLCGVFPPEDAKCVQFGPTTFRCTMTCLSQDDCPSPSTCNIGVSPAVCTL